MAIKQMMQGKAPGAVYEMMMKSNPQFASFVNANRGKTPEQIARENGIDPASLKQLLS